MDSDNIVPFPVREPWQAAVGSKRLEAIEAFEAGIGEIAAAAVMEAFKAAAKIPGAQDIGISDAFPLLYAAFRREIDRPVPF